MYGASLYGNIGIVKQLINHGATNFSSCLSVACQKGHTDLVVLFLKHKPEITQKTLTYATHTGNIGIVRLLIENGATQMKTPLISASYDGFFDIVKLFIENGAHYFNAAAKAASFGGRFDIVKYMIEKGADKFDDCLYAVARTSCCSSAIEIDRCRDTMNLLIEKGATELNKALTAAFYFNNQSAFSDLLIKKGATCIDDLFIEACIQGRRRTLKWLVENYGKTNDVVILNLNVGLYHACSSVESRLDTVSFLIDAGADDLNKALLYASESGLCDVMSLLIERGATKQ